jgi:PEGA domain
MSRVIAVVACGFSLAACSTSLPSLSLLKPPSETLRIESEPPGADAKTTLGQSCRTPCELAVQSGDDLAVTLTLSGYQPQTVAVQREASARLAPNPIFVELEPAPPAPPAKKPIKKKPRVAKAHPAPPVITGATASAAPPPAAAAAPAAAAPAAAPPPMPATPAEPAVSATNYPWPSR